MASQTPRPCIVWFRDDLRLSDHPALHAAVADRRAGDLPLRVRRARQRTRGRLAARRAGGWRNRCAPCRKASRPIGSPLVLRRGAAAKVIAELAREAGAGAVFWNEIAQAPHQAVADQVAAALERSASPRRAFPATCWRRPPRIRNKEGRGLRVFTPFWRRVQALGRSAKAVARAEGAASGTGHCERHARQLAARTHRTRTGPAGCARPGRPARPAQARLKQFLERRRRRLCRASATGPTATAPRDCRRICASARSARGRSGTPRALPPPSIRSSPATSKSS